MLKKIQFLDLGSKLTMDKGDLPITQYCWISVDGIFKNYAVSMTMWYKTYDPDILEIKINMA